MKIIDDEALALLTEKVKKMPHIFDSEVKELINTGKIDLVVPMPLETIRWLYDPESKILLISNFLLQKPSI